MSTSQTKPTIVPRADHTVSRSSISDNALKVLSRLNDGGFDAYLVGGGVRDILTGLTPKDFDVATDATPEEVKALFPRNSRIIGRRFRLVHVVYRGRDVIEVATFRAGHDSGDGGETGSSGRILRDNVFGSIMDDAKRRDFTVNALYYNIANHSVVDYVGGLDDIRLKMFRLIGDPVVRCEEDPVRIIRAARLAAKLDFDIDPETVHAMNECAHLISGMPPARMFEEVLKLFQGGYAVKSFNRLREHNLLQYLFPATAEKLLSEPEPLLTLLTSGLANTDKRVSENKPITPAYLLAFMLWPTIYEGAKKLVAEGVPAIESILQAADEALPEQFRATSIPKRFSGPMREIWSLQPRLEQYTGGRALGLLENRRFRAAYDFLCLRASIDPTLNECATWWTDIQEVDPDDRLELAHAKQPVDGDWKGKTGSRPKSKTRSRRRPHKRRSSSDGSTN